MHFFRWFWSSCDKAKIVSILNIHLIGQGLNQSTCLLRLDQTCALVDGVNYINYLFPLWDAHKSSDPFNMQKNLPLYRVKIIFSWIHFFSHLLSIYACATPKGMFFLAVLVKNRTPIFAYLVSNRVWVLPCSLELDVSLEETILPDKSI